MVIRFNMVIFKIQFIGPSAFCNYVSVDKLLCLVFTQSFFLLHWAVFHNLLHTLAEILIQIIFSRSIVSAL